MPTLLAHVKGIERPNVRVYIPITSMLLLSVLLSALLYLVRRFWP